MSGCHEEGEEYGKDELHAWFVLSFVFVVSFPSSILGCLLIICEGSTGQVCRSFAIASP